VTEKRLDTEQQSYYCRAMIEGKVNLENLAGEMMRLKELQRTLKRDINKYKKAVNIESFSGKRKLTEEEREKLLANFNGRLQRNSWILKKILFQIKRSGCC